MREMMSITRLAGRHFLRPGCPRVPQDWRGRAGVQPRYAAPISTLSSTLRFGNRRMFWNVRATPASRIW